MKLLSCKSQSVAVGEHGWSAESGVVSEEALSEGSLLAVGPGGTSLDDMSNARIFRYFKTRPEIICLAVMRYVRYPLSLRNVEDLLHERGIDITHETVRFGGTGSG